MAISKEQMKDMYVKMRRIRDFESAAAKLFAALKEAGIYVRYFPGERTGNYLRITVGTKEQTEALLSFLREYLKEGKKNA